MIWLVPSGVFAFVAWIFWLVWLFDEPKDSVLPALIIGVVYATIFGWGIIGLWISSLKEEIQLGKAVQAKISRQSWHFRRFYTDESEDLPKSECEYWARIVNFVLGWGLLAVVVSIFIWVVTAVFCLIAWLISFKLDLKNFPRQSFFVPDPSKFYLIKPGHQWFGPALLGLALGWGLWGVVPSLLLPDLLKVLTYSAWVLGALLGIVGVAVLTYKVIIPAVSPLVHFLGARAAGVCRRTVYTD